MRSATLTSIAFALLVLTMSTAALAQSSGSVDLLFTPIKPCRAFDTGLAGDPTPIGPNGYRDFQVAGPTPMDYGGTAGGCGVPSYAEAVALSISARSASSGRIAAYATPFDAPSSPAPVVNAVTYKPNVVVTAQVAVGLSKRYVRIFSTSRARVWGDITGYFSLPIEALVGASGEVIRASRMSASRRAWVGAYLISADRDLTGCVVTASANPGVASVEITGSKLFVRTYELVRLTENLVLRDADTPFSVRVTCP